MTDPASLISSGQLFWKILAKIPIVARWLLRGRYSSVKCRGLLLIDLDGSRARFEILSIRPSHALTSLILRAHNHLPFDVTVNLFQVTAAIQNYQFLDAALNTQITIPSAASVSIHLPEINLGEQQTKWVRELGRECTDVQVELHCRCHSSIQIWEDCRSFVFLASINADPQRN